MFYIGFSMFGTCTVNQTLLTLNVTKLNQAKLEFWHRIPGVLCLILLLNIL